MSVDLNEFKLPEGFEMPVGMSNLGSGVDGFDYGGPKVLPHRFAWETRALNERSKHLGFKIQEQFPVLVFYKDKKTTIPIRLLRKRNQFGVFAYDDTGKYVGEWELPEFYRKEPFVTGYAKFLEAEKQAGLPLDKWGMANHAQIATLASLGIYTLEGFANCGEERVAMLPAEYAELHEEALLAKAAREGVQGANDKIAALSAMNEKQAAEIERLKALVKGGGESSSMRSAKARSKSKAKSKVKAQSGAKVTENGEIQIEE